MRKISRLVIILFCLFGSGCGLHLRDKSMISSNLYDLYFLPEKPYDELSTQLRTLFQSLGIKLVKSKKQARFSIIINMDLFSYSRPDVVDASLPVTLNFIKTASIEIQDNHTNRIITSRDFAVNQSLTLNANQIYTRDANNLIQRQLTRQVVSLIYYWLISTQTKNMLNYAAHIKTTQHAA